MRKDFLMTLLQRSWNGELVSGQFREELGWHVAELAGGIQDVNSRCAKVAARIGIDPSLAPPGDEHRARAIVDTWGVLTVRPLVAERDLCIDRLIVDKALEVNPEDPRLAAALFSLVTKKL